MGDAIVVEGLSKHVRAHHREAGLGGSLRALFRREYRTVRAVEDVSFTIAPGEVVGFLGPNGAGKTTTIRMLSTLLEPTGGSATINGYDVVREDRPPAGKAATVLAAAKVRCSPASPCSLRCAWLRVAALLSSPPLRAVAARPPGRGGKAGSPVELESMVWLAAATTLSRSGLRVTAPIGVQLRVGPLQRRGLASRACWYRA